MSIQSNLTLNDFVIVVNIIDACTERGAFKGNELLAVGQLREKFSEFIKTNKPEEEVPEEVSEEAN